MENVLLTVLAGATLLGAIVWGDLPIGILAVTALGFLLNEIYAE